VRLRHEFGAANLGFAIFARDCPSVIAMQHKGPIARAHPIPRSGRFLHHPGQIFVKTGIDRHLQNFGCIVGMDFQDRLLKGAVLFLPTNNSS
jgi:hypothetical protein